MTTPSESNSMKLLAGAIALCLLTAAVIGIDYSQVRDRAGQVPLNTHRIQSVEKSLKEASQQQAKAMGEFTAAVQELRIVVAEMKTKDQ